jgi:hypothetical protein
MTNTELTEIILDKLGWFYDDIARPKHGKFAGWTKGQLIHSILEYEKGTLVCKAFNCGQQTFNRTVKELLVPIFGRLQGGNETWKFILLNFIQYKKCTVCNQFKQYSEYHLDSHNATNHHSRCKYCRSLDNVSVYGARKLRVPSWHLTEKNKIAEFYSMCPQGFHVDHIIPLQGDLVSGLHTLSNLQYLSSADNIRKGNSFEV